MVILIQDMKKNRAVAYSVLAVVIYFILIKYIGERLFLHSLYIIPTIWIIASYILYSKTIKKSIKFEFKV